MHSVPLALRRSKGVPCQSDMRYDLILPSPAFTHDFRSFGLSGVRERERGHLYIYIYIYVCVCVYVRVYIHTHVFTQLDVCVYIEG